MSWQELLDAAVLGTGRSPVPAAGELLGDASGAAAPEQRLLLALAAASRLRRGTHVPPVLELSTPSRAERSTSPPLSARGCQALADVLTSGHPDVQAEALRVTATAGRALPGALVVAVLELATARTGLRTPARAVVGPAGAWLAGHNPAWAWVGAATEPLTVEQATAQWPLATGKERVPLLAQVRRADPTAGLALLMSTWDTDRSDDLAALLGVLATGLSAADEAALESRLDDRRVQVRRAAAEVLAQLPSSRYCQRAEARLRRYLSVGGLLRKSLAVTPPQTADAEMTRDMVSTDRLPDVGPEGSLLARDAALAPPQSWYAVTGLDAGKLVDLAARTDWWVPLRHAVTATALRHGDTELLVALAGAVTSGRQAVHLANQLAGATDAVRARVLEVAVTRAGTQDEHALLTTVSGPWGPRTSQVMFALFSRMLGRRRHDRGWQLVEAARHAGRCLHPAGPLTLPDVSASSDASYLHEAVTTLRTSYAQRSALHTALMESP